MSFVGLLAYILTVRPRHTETRPTIRKSANKNEVAPPINRNLLRAKLNEFDFTLIAIDALGNQLDDAICFPTVEVERR